MDVPEALKHMLDVLLGQRRSEPGTLIGCLMALDGDEEARRGVGDNFSAMLGRSQSQGWADFTQGWKTHGLTFAHRSNLGAVPLRETLAALVRRHRQEQAAVLWIGIGKTVGTSPVVVSTTDDRSLGSAADEVLRSPARVSPV